MFSCKRKQPGSVSYSLESEVGCRMSDARQKLISDIRHLKSKKMNCENLQFDLSIYSDDILSDTERATVEKHLAQCPLCRQKRDDYLALSRSLRALKRPAISPELLNKVRTAVADEIQTTEITPIVILSDGVQNWFRMRFMPYSLGTAAALLLGISLLWTILAGDFSQNVNNIASLQNNSNQTVMLANANPKDETFPADGLPPAVLTLSDATPSVNPSGALIAVSNSLMRGKMKDDEVVVVADVFSNGLAEIAEVVEPTNNWNAVNELEKALDSDPDYAPFVSSKSDRRSDTVRVIFKIQRVDVNIAMETPRRK